MSRMARRRQRQAERRDAWTMLAVLILGGVVALTGVLFGVWIRR